jgi:hypothetical protein
VSLGAAVTPNPETESAVVAYRPGIRNFKQRLKDLSAKNPFVQQFVQPTSTASGDGQGTSGGATSTGGDNVSIDTGTNISGDGNGGNGGGGGGQKKSGGQTLYTYYVTNVSVGESGGTLTSMNGISQFQFLPSQDKPVLVYLGTSSGGTQALFLVSKDVSGVGGNGTCFPTADDCQLLGLSPGAGADLIYGPDGKTYHVQVNKIKRATSSKPPS